MPAVVGIAKIASEAYPDPTQFDPKEQALRREEQAKKTRAGCWSTWHSFASSNRPIPLSELKAHPALADFRLNMRGNRLSIFPVDKKHWDVVLRLE